MGRKIPKVASASLVLGAMGCGGGTTSSNNSSPTIAGVSKLACENYQTCDPSKFNYYFSSISACATSFTNDFQKHFGSYSATCQKAVLAYYNCYYAKLAASSNACSTTSQQAAATACLGYYNAEVKACK